MKNFALIGAAGFVAERHMAAIKAVGGNLVAALDPHDSVGKLDSYFPSCRFFTEFERFDRFIDKMLRTTKLDYVSIASPNYLHDAHVRFALRSGADAICEKPLVLNVRNLYGLKMAEQETGNKVHSILQLRYHPEALRMRNKPCRNGRHLVSIEYVTPRGKWYESAWKADVAKSGGLCTNIGIHLFDLATWVFGKSIEEPYVASKTDRVVSGRVFLERATVDFRLSIEMSEGAKRVFEVDGESFELSGGFKDLHTEVYRNILAGDSYGIDDALESIRIVEAIRNVKWMGNNY